MLSFAHKKHSADVSCNYVQLLFRSVTNKCFVQVCAITLSECDQGFC